MAHFYKALVVFVSIFFTTLQSFAQPAKSYAVLIERIDNQLPIKIGWEYDSNATAYQVYRRSLGQQDWGAPVANKTATDTQLTEGALSGTYEYYIQKSLKNGKLGSGYLITSTLQRSYQNTARLLLVIDANYFLPLATSINTLIADAVADGWFVDTIVVARQTEVIALKQKITAWYNQYKNDAVKPEALYLLGRIPVPYSGDIFPDGHRPDHRGAWPADVYYGVMNENIWTDNTVDSDSATQARNHNIPSDKRFDVNYIFPDTTALQIGRVDLTNMPLFGQNDTLLIEQYLSKAHAFKTLGFVPARKAIIDDNFGAMAGEAFAASGWRGFANTIGKSNIVEGDYFSTIKNQSYLLSYGCGAGTYTSATGIGSTTQFNSDSINTVYTMLFGSYFGDWDNTNNFLRAPLCGKPMSLVSVWSGRPHWNIHHMAVGYNIGFCAKLAQNNIDGKLLQPQTQSGYVSSAFPTYVHIALMGDPTLRLFYNAIPQQVQSTPNVDSTTYQLNWQAVPNSIGYEVYVSQNHMQIGKLVTTVLSTNCTIDNFLPGNNIVHIRAKFVEQSASGNFEQFSLGVKTSIIGGVNATGLGNYISPAFTANVYPNPSNKKFAVSGSFSNATISVFDVTGKLVLQQQTSAGEYINHELKQGIYIVLINNGQQQTTSKLLVK